jgi:hypothetical protein
VNFHQSGTYRVELTYAIPPHREGTVANVIIGDQQVPFKAESTGGWGEYRLALAGEVTLMPDEELPIRVIPVCIPVGAVMNLRAVHLTRIG